MAGTVRFRLPDSSYKDLTAFVCQRLLTWERSVVIFPKPTSKSYIKIVALFVGRRNALPSPDSRTVQDRELFLGRRHKGLGLANLPRKSRLWPWTGVNGLL